MNDYYQQFLESNRDFVKLSHPRRMITAPEDWAPQHVKFTSEAEEWFEARLEEIIVLYRLGAYQSEEGNDVRN